MAFSNIRNFAILSPSAISVNAESFSLALALVCYGLETEPSTCSARQNIFHDYTYFPKMPNFSFKMLYTVYYSLMEEVGELGGAGEKPEVI